MRRREYLAGATTAAAALAASGTAAAEWSSNTDAKSITHEYDEAFLQRYRPVFVADIDVIEAYKGLYGYKCTSPEYDYEYAYYWSQLTHQDGLPGVGNADAHLLDHEPFIAAVDPDDGLQRAIWSNYHHLAGTAPADELTVVSSDGGAEEWTVMELDPRWHNQYASASENWSRDNFELQNWLDVRDAWRANGYFDETSDAAIEDPQVMLNGRGHWWAAGQTDVWLAQAWKTLGLGGADNTVF